MKGIYLTYEEFNQFCNEEALRLFIAGYNYEDLTDAVILSGYPDGYFCDDETDVHDSTYAFYDQYMLAMCIRIEYSNSITRHKGESYFVVGSLYLYSKGSDGYRHACASAVTRHNEPCTVWWVVPESYELDEDAFNWEEADAVDMND